MVRTLACVLATTAALVACQHRGSDPGARSSQTTTTGASVTSPEVAGAGGTMSTDEQAPLDPNDPAVKLGRTICEHKLVCGDVGRTGAYANMQQCTKEAVRHAQSQFEKLGCDGVAQGALARCETSVWETPCTTPLGATLSPPTCSSRDLCASPGGGPIGG